MTAAVTIVALLGLVAGSPTRGGRQTAGGAPAGTVAGVVVNVTTGAGIPDAQVRLVPVGADAGGRERDERTGQDGRFAFAQVVPGAYTLSVSTVGYIFVSRLIEVTSAALPDLTVPLSEGTGAYRETVDVTADAGAADPGVAAGGTLGSAALQALRGVVTDDPMRAMQALPGVATGDDFQAGFSVRSAAFRHLGVVVDDTPAPLLLHAVRASDNAGSVAMINTDVLDDATLAAGPHARRHGDWLGATLAFRLREGSRDRTGLRAAVSGTGASVVAEGPLGPAGRGSWIVSARRSYLDWLVRQLEPDIDSTIGFADGSAKLVYDLTDRQQVQVTMAGGNAIYREETAALANGLQRATSGSLLASAAWRLVAPRLVLTNRVSFLGADFRNTGVVGQELARGYAQSVSWRTSVAVPIGAWTIEAGGLRERERSNAIDREFGRLPHGQIEVRASRDVSPRTTLTSGWAQVSKPGGATRMAGGARVSRRTGSDGVEVSPWAGIERRTGRFTWRAAASGSAQFPDPWMVPAPGEVARAERGRDVEAGLEQDLGRGVSWRASVFHRAASHVLRFAGEHRLDTVTGERLVANPIASFVPSLDESARGFELVATRRSASGLSGWAGYTWARATARDVRTGETFDADQDQRHTLNVVAFYRASYRTTFGAKLRVGSNVPLTGYFEKAGGVLRLATTRNGVRLPVYARLDLRATRTFTFERRRLTLFAEVVNVLARENIGQSGSAVRPSLEVVGAAERLIPFVPSVGLLIEF